MQVQAGLHDPAPPGPAVLLVSAWEPTGGVRTAYQAVCGSLRSEGFTFVAYAFDGWSVDSPWSRFCNELIGPEGGTLAEVLIRRPFDVVQAIDSVYSPPWGVDVWLRRARFRGGVVLVSHQARDVLTEPPRAPTVYVAVSEAARASLRPWVTAEIRVIPNGVDVVRFSPAPAAPAARAARPTFAWVGRTRDVRDKNPSLFVALAADHPEWSFIIADPDPPLPHASFGSNITYRTQLSIAELVDLYRSVAASGGALVLTSTSESMGYVCVEAAACGCPCIVTDIPGLAWLEDGRTALKFDGTLHDLDRVARRLVSDEGLLHDLAVAGRDLVAREYTVERMVSAYRAVYRDAIRAAPSRHVSDTVVRVFWLLAIKLRRAINNRIERWTN